MPLRDKATRTLVGLAVGDALGGATEGWTPEQIRERYDGYVTGIVPPFDSDWRDARPIAPYHKGDGHITDDTLMTHALVDVYAGRRDHLDAYAIADDPARAAGLAWRDARLSHVRNGVYGAMSVAAMCAQAAASDDVHEVLRAGLAAVPPQSRYAAAVSFGIEVGRSGQGPEACLDALHERYGHLHWVYVLNNAALAAYALTASDGDFEAAIYLAVMGGWDTDSVGATVGSVCGALAGVGGLPARWVEPLRNRVASSLPGFDGIGLDELAARTAAVARR